MPKRQHIFEHLLSDGLGVGGEGGLGGGGGGLHGHGAEDPGGEGGQVGEDPRQLPRAPGRQQVEGP